MKGEERGYWYYSNQLSLYIKALAKHALIPLRRFGRSP